MDAENVAKLIEAIASVLQALGWPLIVIFILVYFGKPLKKFLNDVGELTLDIPGIKTNVKVQQKQIEAAALLGAASAKSSSESKGSAESEIQNAREIAGVVGQSLKPKIIRKLSEASVLWVDDNPSNNYYERSALETLGLSFTISTSTEDALEKIRLRKYDVIISDMGRSGDAQAGYTLLEKVSEAG